MISTVPFAFVWREEQEILARLASNVPHKGLIVEIGTALGGTARIMWEASRANGVDIITVDLFASQRAAANLADTAVRLINEPSEKVAAQWPRFDGRAADLLYIDGDHTLAGIHCDFAGWLPWVQPDGVVVCHDYDPPERGHLAHLGVGVFLDALVRLNPSMKARQDYKLFQGRLPEVPVIVPAMEDCLETWRQQAAKAQDVRAAVFIDNIPEGMARVCQKSAGINSVQACICIDHALRQDFEYIDSMTTDFHGFRRHLETLAMLEHAYGPARFPDRLVAAQPKTLEELSGWVAAEQIRLRVLADILRTLVNWQP